MAATETTKWTYEDLVILGDDGKHHEIIDGEHYVNPAPNIRHQRIVRRLTSKIDTWLEKNPLGEVFASPVDIVLSESDVVQPDLVYVSRERVEIVTTPNIQGAPDIVVEVLSGSNRRKDEIIKRKLYEAKGVSEYWIVDPEIDVIKIYRGAMRAAELTLENDDTLTTPLLPGFALALAKLFA